MSDFGNVEISTFESAEQQESFNSKWKVLIVNLPPTQTKLIAQTLMSLVRNTPNSTKHRSDTNRNKQPRALEVVKSGGIGGVCQTPASVFSLVMRFGCSAEVWSQGLFTSIHKKVAGLSNLLRAAVCGRDVFITARLRRWPSEAS